MKHTSKRHYYTNSYEFHAGQEFPESSFSWFTPSRIQTQKMPCPWIGFAASQQKAFEELEIHIFQQWWPTKHFYCRLTAKKKKKMLSSGIYNFLTAQGWGGMMKWSSEWWNIWVAKTLNVKGQRNFWLIIIANIYWMLALYI